MRRILAGSVFLVVASVAFAEARLVPGWIPSFSVEVTPAGPWTVVGDANPLTLNPNGDRIGDGTPGWAMLDSTVLVAWVSPSSNSIRLAASSWTSWTTLPSVPATDAFGTPKVAGAGPHYFTAWMTEPSSPRISVVAVLADGDRSNVLGLGPGFLVGLAALDGAVHLLVQELDGGLVTHATLPINDIGAPIERAGSIVLESSEVRSPLPSLPFDHVSAPIERSAPTVLIPPFGWPSDQRALSSTDRSSGRGNPDAGARSALPGRGGRVDLRPRLHSGMAEGEPWAVATWWPNRWTVKAVAFTGEGPDLESMVELPSPIPYSLELEALAVETVTDE
ncbi:MAG: hypothetical protein AAF533_28610 [Acidobacteriota bacterium]